MINHIRSFLRRNAQVIPLTVIALCISGIFLLQAITIGTLSQQVEYQNTVIAETKKITENIRDNAANRTKQIDSLDRHLDCIVQFFAEPNRGAKQIADIDQCRISSNVQNGSSPSPPINATPQSSPQPTTQQPAAEATTPTEPTAAKPSFVQNILTPITKSTRR